MAGSIGVAERGRFAPSPTGDLHLGNLRTALVAWLAARRDGGGFVVRMEDLDRVTSHPRHEAAQLRDLASLGIDWDGPVVRQSERFDRYRAALDQLDLAGHTYPCYCTRREVRDAARAPHGGAAGAGYPGTCRVLPERRRRELEREGRRPAVRLRAGDTSESFDDAVVGNVAGAVGDVVLQRNDGVPAYHLAVVCDDAAQGVTQVVRGDDLSDSTPSQIHLQRLMHLPTPCYAHVPLVIAPDGQRLAKRHGAVTLTQLLDAGATVSGILARLAHSLGLTEDRRERPTLDQLLARFDLAAVDRRPWVVGTGELERPAATMAT